MKIFLFVLCVCSAVNAVNVNKRIDACGDNCLRENNCACQSRSSPLPTNETPQFVTITFDDAALFSNYKDYFTKFLFDRKNPDGTPISASIYVPHEDSDYQVVNELFNRGFDIGLHSVTKAPVEWWANASKEEIEQEFSDNRIIISKFANIPSDSIIGARTPHLQINGDETYGAYNELKLVYDNSWVSLAKNKLFPFTLDYKRNEESANGISPIESYPGFWVTPIINFEGFSGRECNSLYGCLMEGTTEEIRGWLFEQFQSTYSLNRAPVNILLNAVWFLTNSDNIDAFSGFLDDLGAMKDVFLVGHSEVIAWSRNPVPLESYKTNHQTKSQSCTPITCILYFEEKNQTKRMRSCVPCPNNYPWLGNPNGN